jgi:hypothetical protein
MLGDKRQCTGNHANIQTKQQARHGCRNRDKLIHAPRIAQRGWHKGRVIYRCHNFLPEPQIRLLKLRDKGIKRQAGMREVMDYFAMAWRSVMDITISKNG